MKSAICIYLDDEQMWSDLIHSDINLILSPKKKQEPIDLNINILRFQAEMVDLEISSWICMGGC